MKRKLLFFSLLMLAMGGSLFAQIQTPTVVRYDGYVAPLGGGQLASVAVCASGGSGGPPCSPLAVIYSDQYGTAQQSNPFTADSRGHYIFFAPAASYAVQTYGTGYSTVLSTITLTGSSGSGSSSSSPSSSAFFLSPSFLACGSNPNCFITPWNTRQISNCGWNNTQSTITCPSGSFTSADVGKRIEGSSSCLVSLPAPLTVGTQSGATVSAFISSSQVSISNPATGTVGAASATCIFLGSLDDTALSAVDAAAQLSPTCPIIYLPMGMGSSVQPHFFTSPPACEELPEISGGTNLNWGFEVAGMGPYATQLLGWPDYNLAACTHGVGGIACMGGFQFYFKDWTFTGGSWDGAGTATAFDLIELGALHRYAKLENFGITNFAVQDANANCLHVRNAYQAYGLNLNVESSCGTGLRIEAGTAFAGCTMNISSSTQNNVFINGGTLNVGCAVKPPSTAGTPPLNFGANFFASINGDNVNQPSIYNNGGTANLENTYVLNAGTGATSKYTMWNVGGTVNLTNSTILQFNHTSSEAFHQQGGTLTLTNSSISNTTGVAINFASGTNTMQDVGINTFSGTVIGSANIIPVGGGSNSSGITTASTNFGVNLTAQTVLASAFYPATLTLRVSSRQVTAGVGCGAGSNTALGTLSWTTGGAAQTATINTLTISANGTVGTSIFQLIPIRADSGTAVTFTTTSTLASAGCSTTPQYAVDAML